MNTKIIIVLLVFTAGKIHGRPQLFSLFGNQKSGSATGGSATSGSVTPGTATSGIITTGSGTPVSAASTGSTVSVHEVISENQPEAQVTAVSTSTVPNNNPFGIVGDLSNVLMNPIQQTAANLNIQLDNPLDAVTSIDKTLTNVGNAGLSTVSSLTTAPASLVSNLNPLAALSNLNMFDPWTMIVQFVQINFPGVITEIKGVSADIDWILKNSDNLLKEAVQQGRISIQQAVSVIQSAWKSAIKHTINPIQTIMQGLQIAIQRGLINETLGIQVLVKSISEGLQNRVFTVASGALTSAVDLASNAKILSDDVATKIKQIANDTLATASNLVNGGLNNIENTVKGLSDGVAGLNAQLTQIERNLLGEANAEVNNIAEETKTEGQENTTTAQANAEVAATE